MHEKTGDIITFAQFEEGYLLENRRSLVEDESISDSIDYSYVYDNSDDISINMDALEDIRDGNYVHLDINARDSRLKYVAILVKLKVNGKYQNSQRKSMGKGLHKLFKAVVEKLNHSLPDLGEPGSEYSHFIPKHSKFSKVIRLPEEVKRFWLKENLK